MSRANFVCLVALLLALSVLVSWCIAIMSERESRCRQRGATTRWLASGDSLCIAADGRVLE
jgi:hypothetical protein